MPESHDPADPTDEPDRTDELARTEPGLDEPARQVPDADDLPAGEPEDNPDDLRV